MSRKFLEAVAILVGTIVGAGTFGLPYVVMRAGILVGLFYFLFLGLIVLLIHLIYGEIVLRTSAIHRIVGYGEVYLGQPGKKMLLISALVGLLGSKLVYLILGGSFLTTIFGDQGRGVLFYIIIFWAFLSLGIVLDWKRISFLEFFMTALLILVMVIIVIYGFSYFQVSNFQLINFKYFFLPWGVIFYALSGASAIPELREVLGPEKLYIKKAIIIGTIIPIVIYLFFALSVVGATGYQTTEEAISGIKNLFGNGVTFLAVIFGVLSVATSYLVMGMVLKKIFIYDLKINRLVTTLIVCSAPLILYLLGLQNFIKIISFLGLWLGAVEGILLLVIHKRAQRFGDRQPEYSLSIPKFIYYLIALIFILGPVLSVIFLQY
ncbi:MAG: aromatic amino acid transport family protein [Patescibacteria group bacterium]